MFDECVKLYKKRSFDPTNTETMELKNLIGQTGIVQLKRLTTSLEVERSMCLIPRYEQGVDRKHLNQ